MYARRILDAEVSFFSFSRNYETKLNVSQCLNTPRNEHTSGAGWIVIEQKIFNVQWARQHKAKRTFDEQSSTYQYNASCNQLKFDHPESYSISQKSNDINTN